MNFAKRTIKSPYHFALKTHLPDELSNHWHYALPWTYYLLDGGQRQHAVYEGRQISNLTPYNCGNAHEVFWVASEYLIHGAGDVPFLSLLPNGDKRYRIQDNLGSTRVVLTADGSLYDWNDYEPFGTVLNSSGGQQVSDRLSYIGKEKDAESDLGDFGVRKYESETGRFLSVDPLWEEQRPWNVYHYSANNPIILKDPNGEAPVGATPTDHTPRYEDPMRNGAGGDPKSGSSGGGRIRTAVQGAIKGSGTFGESTLQQEEARARREAQSQVQIAESKGTFGGKQSTESTTAREAFRNAKEANGIPRSQQPVRTRTEKDKNTGKPLRVYDYKNSKGENISIRKDNPVKYKDGGKQGTHYNAGETGKKLNQHHNYGGGTKK